MQDFHFLMTHDRYAVPTVTFVQTRDEASVRRLAQKLLLNRRHQEVEVWTADRRLCKLTALDEAIRQQPRPMPTFSGFRGGPS
jgi:hypothetical protein